MKVSRYRKAIVAIGGVVAIIVKAVADGVVDPGEVGEIVTSIAVATGVFAFPNTD